MNVNKLTWDLQFWKRSHINGESHMISYFHPHDPTQLNLTDKNQNLNTKLSILHLITMKCQHKHKH